MEATQKKYERVFEAQEEEPNRKKLFSRIDLHFLPDSLVLLVLRW